MLTAAQVTSQFLYGTDLPLTGAALVDQNLVGRTTAGRKGTLPFFITNTAAGVVIAVNADDSLTLAGLAISQLRADDFLFV